MKKNKLLKVLGCAALIAAPIIVTPIILTTGCASTNPITPEIKVNSIEKIVFFQDGVMLENDYLICHYIFNIVENNSAMPSIDFKPISIYFQINNKLENISYVDIADQISFEISIDVCASTYSNDIFEIKNGAIVTSAELWRKSYLANNDGQVRFVLETDETKGWFSISFTTIEFTWGVKNSTIRNSIIMRCEK